LLYEAIGLCKDARSRENSSIPKVEGRLGDFTYRILNLDDPLAVAVGYLSHCCFVVQGISYSALKHSMQSSNGRTFVVYYQGKFLTQSWVWRNGDVICFDSVEAGSAQHGMYKDDIKLVDVYQQAAREMLYISAHTEDELQKIKVVTVGKKTGKVAIKGCGTATITLKAAGNSNYKASTKKISVTIKPKQITGISLKSSKKKTLIVKWKKDSKATGYEIQYSLNKNFKKATTKIVKKNSITSKTVTKLKAKKRYYVKVRAYKISNKKKIYGAWSKSKNIVIKK